MQKIKKGVLILLCLVLCFSATAMAAQTKTTKYSTKYVKLSKKATWSHWKKNTTVTTKTRDIVGDTDEGDIQTTHIVTKITKTVKIIWTKGSRYKKIRTKTVTVVNKTITITEPEYSDGNYSISFLAPEADNKLLNAFNKLGFKAYIKKGLSKTGKFDPEERTLTIKRYGDSAYHELGHFLAFVATGNSETDVEFEKIYNEEKSKYTGEDKSYAISTSEEYFAESYKDYVLNRSTLKSKRPKTYNYICDALDKVTDEQIEFILWKYDSLWD